MTMQIDGSNGWTFNDGSTQKTAYTPGMRNRIINGAMMIDQRNAGASVTPSGLAGTYTLDRWCFYASATAKYTTQQNAGAVTPPTGFKNYLGITSSSAYSVTSTDNHFFGQKIEGLNCADLAWGTVNAQPIVIGFWARSSLTGTFGGSLTNANQSRCYPFTYTINSANTWEYKTVNIAGDTTGTWNTDNTVGLWLNFNLGTGTTYSGTAGVWASTTYVSATGTVNLIGTNAATLYITGVQLEKGSTATLFEYRPYGQELALCQRYFWLAKPGASSSGFMSGLIYGATTAIYGYQFQTAMRASPTVGYSALSDFNVIGGSMVLTPSSIAVGTASPYQMRIDFGIIGGTTGQGSVLQSANANTYLSFNAEL